MEEAQRIPKANADELFKVIGKSVKEYFTEHQLDLNRMKHLLRLIYYDIEFEKEFE